MNENAAPPYCRGGNNTGAPKTITRCTTCRPKAARNCGCFSNQARVRIRADSSHQTRGLARASAQQRVCLCLAIRRGSPFSQRAQCALLDKVKTQMECKKDVLERDDDSATMAALFPLWCLGLFFFLPRPKTSAARFVGGGRGSGKQEAIQTNESIINTNCERHML